ncbi:terpene synthase family protein [Streptomyces syringium]|uniref:terpene synthase family protein n=1 Tax=Streptomyces syringium TaxID=76729 RepID=UPI00339DF462
MSAETRFSIPDLYCPFTGTCDQPQPAAEGVGRDIAALVHDLDDNPALAEMLAELRLGEFTARLSPRLTTEGNWLMQLYWAIYFTSDHWCDRRPDGTFRETAEAVDFCRRTVRVLCGEPVAADDPVPTRLAAFLRERLDEYCPGWTDSRLPHYFGRNMTARLWEIDVHRSGRTPSLAEYRRIKVVKSGPEPLFELDILAHRLCIPSWIRAHPAVETLQEIAADYIARYTDIVTVSKDLHEGTMSNIVTVIRAERGCTLQNAVDTAAEIIRADADAFVDLRARLPHLGAGCHPDLESFLDRLQEWMANCEPWARNLPRYSKHYDEAG